MKAIDILATVLLVVGVAHFDLVATLFGDMTILSRIVYSLVGLAAIYRAVSWKAVHRRNVQAYASH